MQMKTARFDASSTDIRIDGGGRLWMDGYGTWIAARDVVFPTSISSLRAAMRRANYYLGGSDPSRVELYDVDEDVLASNEEAFGAPDVELAVFADRVHVLCTLAVAPGQRLDRVEISVRLGPVLKRRKLTVVDVTHHEHPADLLVTTVECKVLGVVPRLVPNAADGWPVGE